MSAHLLFLTGKRASEDIELTDPPITFGRHPSLDVALEDDLVSRRHASIEVRDGRYVVIDLGSTNGTFVNDRKIKEQVLRDGDVIEFGIDGPSARFIAQAVDESDLAATVLVVPEAATAKPRTGNFCTECAAPLLARAAETRSGDTVILDIDEISPHRFCPRCDR